jgi:hypothetical protein
MHRVRHRHVHLITTFSVMQEMCRWYLLHVYVSDVVSTMRQRILLRDDRSSIVLEMYTRHLSSVCRSYQLRKLYIMRRWHV